MSCPGFGQGEGLVDAYLHGAGCNRREQIF